MASGLSVSRPVFAAAGIVSDIEFPKRPDIAAPAAPTAIVASRQAVDATRTHGSAFRNHTHPQPKRGRYFLDDALSAVERKRRQKLPIGPVRDVLERRIDTNEALVLVVVWSEVLIGDRPILAVTVAVGGLEVVITQPARIAAPMKELSAHAPRPHPDPGCPRRGRIGVLAVVDVEGPDVFTRGPLNGIDFLPVAWPVESPKRHLVRLAVGEEGSRIKLRSRLQE